MPGRTRRVLYLGDTALDNAARFLAAAIRDLRWHLTYVPTPRRPPAGFWRRRYDLFIVSDYPASRFTQRELRSVAQAVAGGSSFLMVGGWGSFRGSGGHYHATAIADLLPVRCLDRDDRVQGAPAYRIVPADAGRIFHKFDFDAAPSLCGFNRVRPKQGAREILSVATVRFVRRTGKYRVVARDPLLVLGRYGKGRTAALTTDLSPHWAGGLIDWGTRRWVRRAAPGIYVEAGDTYFRFVKTLLGLLS